MSSGGLARDGEGRDSTDRSGNGSGSVRLHVDADEGDGSEHWTSQVPFDENH